jgi:hypothetical protein
VDRAGEPYELESAVEQLTRLYLQRARHPVHRDATVRDKPSRRSRRR